MIKRFLNTQTKNVTIAAGILGVATLLSRLLGLVRNRLLATSFGASSDLDIYFAAFRLPDLVFNVLIAGGILVAFLPVFSEYYSNNKEEAWKFTNNLLGVFFILMIGISLIFLIFAPFFVKLVTPGFSPDQFKMTVLLTRLMFLSPLLLGISNIFSGILHFFNKFVAYSISPIVYNLGIIFGIIFLSPMFGIFGVGVGVIIGAFLHLLVQLISSLFSGFKFKLSFNFKGLGIKKVFSLMIPRTVGVAASQLNLLAITAIASSLSGGSISIFNFANNVYEVPIGIIGISFAVAAFPSFSKLWIEGNKEKLISVFNSIFRKVILIVLPLSFAFFILRNQIVRILFGTGKFGLIDSQLTAACLGLLSFGVLAGTLIPLVFRAFFTAKDTKTPTLISIGYVLLNIVLSLSFINLLSFENSFSLFLRNILSLNHIDDISIIGLSLAFSISTIIQLVFFLIFLGKKIGGIGLKNLFNIFLKVGVFSLIMSFFVSISLGFLSKLFISSSFFDIFIQTSIASVIGLAVYLLLSFIFIKEELKSVIGFMFKKKKLNE
jgi:putative peptidoglycan lipid II flippase